MFVCRNSTLWDGTVFKRYPRILAQCHGPSPERDGEVAWSADKSINSGHFHGVGHAHAGLSTCWRQDLLLGFKEFKQRSWACKAVLWVVFLHVNHDVVYWHLIYCSFFFLSPCWSSSAWWWWRALLERPNPATRMMRHEALRCVTCTSELPSRTTPVPALRLDLDACLEFLVEESWLSVLRVCCLEPISIWALQRGKKVGRATMSVQCRNYYGVESPSS